jgi:hypothetical protein
MLDLPDQKLASKTQYETKQKVKQRNKMLVELVCVLNVQPPFEAVELRFSARTWNNQRPIRGRQTNQSEHDGRLACFHVWGRPCDLGKSSRRGRPDHLDGDT